MSELPRGWGRALLEDVTDAERVVRYGILKPGPEFEGGVPVVKVRDYPNGKILVDGLRRTSPEIDEKYARSRIRPGDLLLSIRGTYGRACQVPPELTVANITQDSARIVPVDGLDARYMLHYLRSPAAGHYFDGVARGVAVKGVNIGDLRKLPVPVPPLPEQRRIVAAIEEHFSRLDVAEEGLRRSRARAGALDESALSALIAGAWPTAVIGEVARVGSGSTPLRSESRYWEGGHVPWVTSAAVNQPRITEPSALITDDALAETSVKLWPPGTVLVAMYGEGKTRGKAAVLDIESTCNQACAAIVPSDDVEAEFLRMVLTSRYEQNRKLASGGVQPNLSLGLIRDMRIPLPGVATQRKLVEAASRSAESTERFTSEVAQAERRSASLRRSILAAAFSGRLVPQNPTDEPASVLLDRIESERAAAKPPRRKKGAAS